MLKTIMQILIAALFCAGPGFAQDDLASSDAQQRQLQVQQWLGADYVLSAQKSDLWQDKLVAGLLAPIALYTDSAGNVTQRELLGDAMRLAPREPLVYVAALSVCRHDCERDALVARLQQLDPDNAAVYYMLAQQAYRRGQADVAQRALRRGAGKHRFDDYDQRFLTVALQQLKKRLRRRPELLPEGWRELDMLVGPQVRLPGSYILPGCIDKTVYEPAPEVARPCLALGKLMAKSQSAITVLIGLALQRRAWETLGGETAPQRLETIAKAKADLNSLVQRSGSLYSGMDLSRPIDPAISLQFWTLRARMGEVAAAGWGLAHPEVFGLAGSGRSGGEQQ